MGAATVKIKDLGWGRLQQEIRRADRSFVKVGFPDGAEVVPGNRFGSGREAAFDITEVQAVASVHEFGAPRRNIPQRPFLRPAFDENRAKINAFVDREYQKVLNGQTTVEASLTRLGLYHEAHVKAKITKVKDPPLKPVTIARKKSSNPLIDTGQMRNTVTSAVFVHGD